VNFRVANLSFAVERVRFSRRGKSVETATHLSHTARRRPSCLKQKNKNTSVRRTCAAVCRLTSRKQYNNNNNKNNTASPFAQRTGKTACQNRCGQIDLLYDTYNKKKFKKPRKERNIINYYEHCGFNSSGCTPPTHRVYVLLAEKSYATAASCPSEPKRANEQTSIMCASRRGRTRGIWKKVNEQTSARGPVGTIDTIRDYYIFSH